MNIHNILIVFDTYNNIKWYDYLEYFEIVELWNANKKIFSINKNIILLQSKLKQIKNDVLMSYCYCHTFNKPQKYNYVTIKYSFSYNKDLYLKFSKFTVYFLVSNSTTCAE